METENRAAATTQLSRNQRKSSAFANLSGGEDLESSANDITRLLRTHVHCCFLSVYCNKVLGIFTQSQFSFSFPSEDIYRINYKETTFNKADERFPVRRKRMLGS